MNRSRHSRAEIPARFREAIARGGFDGTSSMERLPVEAALTRQTRAFKRIKGH